MKHAMLQSQSGSSRNVWNDEDEETDEKQSLMESERLHQQQQLQEELEFEQVFKFSKFAFFPAPSFLLLLSDLRQS